MNLDWVINEFEKLKVMSEVVTRARILADKLITLTEEKITAGKLIFSEFFTLIVGLRFATELIQERYFMPSVDIHARRKQEVIPRTTLPSDVDQVISRIKDYWNSRFPLLKRHIEKKKIPIKSHAGKWLDLIVNAKQDLTVERSYLRYRVTNDTPPVTIEEICGAGSVELIVDELEKIVRYHEHGLNKETESKFKQILPLTYSINELTSRWGTNEKNIIATCNQNKNLWAYIDITNELRLENFHHKVLALETKKKISKGEVDSNYKYPHRGFARIAKHTSVNGGITLQYFYSNSIVNAARGALTLLWVEPPLCNRVLGVYSQHIEADKPFSPVLYFMQDEIHFFERSREFKKLFPNNKIILQSTRSQGSRAKSARKNGKKSGAARRESADQIWKRVKPAILELAKGLTGKSANHIAGVAVRKKMTSKSQSLTGKYIREDSDFTKYIR